MAGSDTKPSAEGTGKVSGNVSLPVIKVSSSPAPEGSQEYKVKSTPPPPKKSGNSDSPSPENSPPSQNSPPPPPKSPSPSPPPPPFSPPPPSSSPPPSPPPPSPPPSSPPPSSPKTATTSPPPKSSPPPESVSPPPPPPENSKESSPPPASGKAPGKSEGSSPPTPVSQSPPPSKGSTPPPPPSQFVSPPAPPPQKSNTPQTPGQAQSPRVSPGEFANPPSQSGSTATPSGSISPALSPPGSRSLANSADPQNQSGNDGHSAVGLAVGGSVIVALAAIAMALFLLRRNNKRTVRYGNHMYTPPTYLSVKTDGNHYNKQQTTPNRSMPPSYTGTGGAPGSTAFGNAKTFFRYEEVMEITKGFSRLNVIGEGGFGCVYKGFLPDGKLVAVKQLKAGSSQGEREFRAEVEIISRVHHRHLVSLVGYCIAEQQRLLIYEFVPNNTLEHHLHGKGLPVLDWSKRLKIAIGSAKGLAYLHEDCHPRIIHRDIKTANILLDNEFEAQVADFGLARLNDTTQTHVSTRIMGTYGYLAPEYATSGKLTDRSDVYSFGVVLLELITGRKALDSQYEDDEVLVEWARERLLDATESGDVSKIVDPRLEKHYVESELLRMIKMAALCVRHSAPHRPRMVQVVRALDEETSDIYSGLKVGQSMAYDSARYNEDILNFRKTAFGFNDDSADFNMSSEEFSMENGGGNQSSGMYRDSSSECLCPDPYS